MFPVIPETPPLPELVAPLFVTLTLTVSVPLVFALTAGEDGEVGVVGDVGDWAELTEEVERFRVG